MTRLLRALGAATSLGMALAGLTSCTAADRAVTTADQCSDSSAAPTPDRHEPGQAILMAPAVRSSLPVGPVRGWEQVVSVADGRTTLAAVHTDGTVSVVGVDYQGSLAGTGGGAGETLAPRVVPGISDAVSVAAVGSSFLVTHRDGTVTGWGDPLIADGGQRDDELDGMAPTRVGKVEDIVHIADGSLNVLALRADGRVTGWGTNLVRSLGEPNGTRVRDIKDVSGAVSIANPGDVAVIATGAGEVCAWGNNQNGLLGVEPRGGETARPVRVGDLEGVSHVAGGINYALALDREGRVWAWGRTVSGVLGDGNTENTAIATPREVPGLPPLTRIFAADSASYGIDDDGGLWAWGGSRREGPYENTDRLPYLLPLPGPAQEVSGNVVLLGPSS
ncbi:RCC1 domain-containing protein [Dietzia sp. NPDC055340]